MTAAPTSLIAAGIGTCAGVAAPGGANGGPACGIACWPIGVTGCGACALAWYPPPPGGAGQPPGGHAGGAGLVGMRERVAGFGGEVSAGPAGDHPGWRVRARIPYGGQDAG